MSAEKTAVPKIYAAMNRVIEGFGVLLPDKNGPQNHNSYPYLSNEKIVANLSPLLVKHGIVMTSRVIDSKTKIRYGQDPDVTTSPEKWSGKIHNPRTVSKVTIEYDFISIEDGSVMTSVGVGESADTGDKALRKATTTAYKTMLLQTFAIASQEGEVDGTDVEGDMERTSEAASKKDRGQQMTEKARPKAKAEPKAAPKPPPAAPQAPAGEAEKPETVSRATGDLPAAKASLKSAMDDTGTTQIQVNEIGKRITGKERNEWLKSVPMIQKIEAEIRGADLQTGEVS